MTAKSISYMASSCVGCGHCCNTAICIAGQAHFGVSPHPPCPGLVKVGVQYRCTIAERYSEEMAIGAGCSSTLFNTVRDEMIERLRNVRVQGGW